MTDDNQWQTSITEIAPNSICVRGYDVAELMDHTSFSDTIFLVLKGELPDQRQSEMFRAIMVSSVDHGVTPPSVLAARTVMSAGNSLNTAVAAGIMAIGDVHGGAIEQSARIMQETAKKEGDVGTLAQGLVATMKEKNLRMPGYGHRLHTADPRTAKLFEIAAKNQFSGRHTSLAQAIEKAFAESGGKPLPINVDGAIAAVTSDMGFDWRLGKAFFMLSRISGLIAHVYEEKITQKPMRKLGDTNAAYVGPARRSLK